MRVVFCGSGTFATPSLRAIIASGHEVVGVVTQPPRRAGRGGRLRATEVAALADGLGLGVLETPDINADHAAGVIAAARPDAICVAQFGQMVSARVRELAATDAFNLHGSLLPDLRGAAPVNWAIIRGLRRTGVTTFSLVDRMDAGDVYLRAATDIAPGERADHLLARLAHLGAESVCQTLDLLSGGQAERFPQDHDRATYAPRLTKADGIIRWGAEAQTLCNLIHGTWPWPGGRTVFARQGGRMLAVTIASACVVPGAAGRPAGEIDSDLTVATGEGRLRITEIKPAGKRLMSWQDFVNGYRAAEGDCFVDGDSVDNA